MKFALFSVTSALMTKVAVDTTPYAATASSCFGQGHHAHMVTPCIMETELDHARHMKMLADVLVSVRTFCRTHMQCPACGACNNYTSFLLRVHVSMCYARTPASSKL